MPINMWFTKQATGYKSWFSLVRKNGSLAPGIPAGSFIVTIINPADTASSSPAVSESAVKPGLYFFEVPSAFLIANGLGEYGVSVEVSHIAPPLRITRSFGATLRVTDMIFDDVMRPGTC